jgi:hypothetical protein
MLAIVSALHVLTRQLLLYCSFQQRLEQRERVLALAPVYRGTSLVVFMQAAKILRTVARPGLLKDGARRYLTATQWARCTAGSPAAHVSEVSPTVNSHARCLAVVIRLHRR